jgi:hypothetical protein
MEVHSSFRLWVSVKQPAGATASNMCEEHFWNLNVLRSVRLSGLVRHLSYSVIS